MAQKAERWGAGADVYDDGCLRVEYKKYYAACANKPLYNLTAKEFLILSCLVKDIGRPVPQPVIWAEAWGEEQVFDQDSSKSLRVHVSALRRKLKCFGLHILTKPGIGYTLTTSECICLPPSEQVSANQ